MFEYAAARALALRCDTTVQLDLQYLNDRTWRPKPLRITFRKYDLDIFVVDSTLSKEGTAPLYVFGKIGLFTDLCYRRIFKPKGVERHFQFNAHFEKFTDGTFLDGAWQSPKYFTGYEDVIRKDFVFKHEPSSPQIAALAEEIRKEESVCVHVRRADFVGNPLHDICDTKYYVQGIVEIEKRGQIGKVYVFSDDIEWCKKNMTFSYPTVFVGDEYFGVKAGGNMYLMSQCKYFVIANSSFSWWGAWLSEREGKVVVAPKRWLADATIDTSDVTPSEWVRI